MRNLQELGLLTLPHELERQSTFSEQDALRWLGVSKAEDLDTKTRTAFNELWRRYQLQRGLVPELKTETDVEGAQHARLIGYLATMEDRSIDAIDAYERAFVLSVSEDESAAVKYMTARSLETLLFNVGVDFPGRDERRALVRDRLKSLEPKLHGFYLDLAMAERDESRRRFKDSAEEVDRLRMGDPDLTIFKTRSIALERVLTFFEQYLFAPTVIASTAAETGLGRWEDDDKVSAAALFARYGCRELALRCRVEARQPRPTAIDTDLLQELLRHSRWPHERHARVAALVEVVAELTKTQRPMLFDLALESFIQLTEHARLLTHRSAMPAGPAICLGVAVGRYSTWQDFQEWVTKLEAAVGDNIAQLGEANWLELPFAWWVRNDSFRASEADNFLHFLVRIAEAGLRFSLDGVIDLIAGLVLHHDVQLPKEGRAVQALVDWLGDSRVANDNDEWLRTEAVIALGKLRGLSPEATRRGRGNDLRELIAAHLDKGTWPSPFAVRAWVGCLDAELSRDDLEIVRRLLAVPFATPRDDLSARREREMRINAKSRMMLWACLTPLSEEDRRAGTQFFHVIAGAMPEALSEFPERSLSIVDSELRVVFNDVVADAFHPTGGHNQRPESMHAAVSCLAVAAKNAHLKDIPLAWLFGAAGFTTTARPELAAYACATLRNCVMRWSDEWTPSHSDVLAELRRAFLRSTRDGRAYVVGAARRALLDIAAHAHTVVQQNITEHPDTLKRLAELVADERLAVVAGGERWTRTNS